MSDRLKNILFELGDYLILFLLYLICVERLVIHVHTLDSLLSLNKLLWLPLVIPILIQIAIFAISVSEDTKTLFPLLELFPMLLTRPWNVSELAVKGVRLVLGIMLVGVFFIVSRFVYVEQFSNTMKQGGYDVFSLICQSHAMEKHHDVRNTMMSWPVKTNDALFERFILLYPLLKDQVTASEKKKIAALFDQKSAFVRAVIAKHLEADTDFFLVVRPEVLTVNSLTALYRAHEAFARLAHFPSALQKKQIESFKLLWLYGLEQELGMGKTAAVQLPLPSDHAVLTAFVERKCLSGEPTIGEKALEAAIGIYPLLVAVGWSENSVQENFKNRSKNKNPLLNDIYGPVWSKNLFWGAAECDRMVQYFLSPQGAYKGNGIFKLVQRKFEGDHPCAD